VILDRLAAAEHQLDALSGLDGGRLRIGAFPTANATLIPLALTAFDGEHPSVCLSLRECTTGEAGPLLAAGELDLAVVSDAGNPGEDIELEQLMDDPMHLALPRNHHLVDKPEIAMADLRDEIWIEGRDGICRTKLMAAAERAGFEPRVAFQSTEWLGKQGLVAAGVGITLIPTVALATVRDDIVLRSLADGPTRTISIATHSSRYRAPGVEPMRAILRRVAAEHCFACDAMVV
jgi:DNA-binding transcriptional LysR family regulator